MAQQLAGLAGILQNIQIPPGVYPTSIQLPSPPKLEGALAPNDLLSKAKRHAYNRVFGPESMVVYKGYVYTGQADGWLVEVSPFGAIRRLARFATRACPRMGPRGGACGRPMGIRLDKDGFLIVADAYHGIFKVNPKSGRFRQLVNPRIHRPKNRALGFINDLTISKDGLIFFTSSSTKWPLSKEESIVLEGDYSGRVLYYNPHEVRWTQRVKEVLTNMSFPNGIQIAKDDSYLLVGEGTTSRIHRVWLGPKPPKPQRLEVFAENLPGVVGNIRLSPRGTYWVGFSQTRLQGLPSILDLYGRQPRIRGALITLMNNGVAFHKNRYGMVVEMDGEGKMIRSLQDPQSKVYTSVSEVQEENGILFFASPQRTFIGFLKLPPSPSDQTGSGTGSTGSGTVPTGSGSPGSGTGAGTPGTGTGTSTGTGTGIPSSGGGLGSPLVSGLTYPLSQNPKVIAFLAKVRNNAMRMTADRIRQVVMALIKHLILVKRQAILIRRLADGKEEELQRIKQVLRQLQQNRPSPGTQSPLPPTTAASPTGSDTTPAAGGQKSSSTSASVEATTATTASSGQTSEVTTSSTDTTASTSNPGTSTAASVQTTGRGESGSSGTSTAANSETSTTTSTTNSPTTTVEMTTTTNAPATTTTAPADITTTTAAATTTTSESTTTTAAVEATTTTTAATTASTTAVESTTSTTPAFNEG